MSSSIQDSIAAFLIFVITGAIVATAYVRHVYLYWKRGRVPYLEPRFPFGNSDFLIPKGVSIGVLSKKFYDEFRSRGDKIELGGVYVGIVPNLVVLHPDLIKDVLVKDFQSFTDRGVYHTESDPLTVHLFSQPGKEWKNARIKFTAVFTSAKMKAMFQTMLDCSDGLKEALDKMEQQKGEVDMLEVAACFTTDVIGSCVFGVECNSFKHPNAEFRKMGRKYFKDHNFLDRFNLFLSVYMPNFARKIGVRNIQKDISRFFLSSIQDTVNYREANNVRRNDFLQLLIDMKNSEVRLTMKELTGQIFLFFTAGFETSSTTTCLALFEISRNEKVQRKLREEIHRVLKKHNNMVTYDAIAEMKYLSQVVDETLRLWPSIATITRVCTKDYTFQNSDVTVEKGTPILISALGLHHDPEFWPEPMLWDPDRFSEENKEKIRPFTYLPFGEGPRNCIALRFGLLQSKIALVTILNEYKISLSPKTVTPLGMDPQTFVLVTRNKVYLRLDKL